MAYWANRNQSKGNRIMLTNSIAVVTIGGMLAVLSHVANAFAPGSFENAFGALLVALGL